MDQNAVEKAAAAVLIALLMIAVGIIGVCGWAVIEIVNWLTSK